MGGKKQKKKRVFAGKNMHLEYHTVNPKKPKASDCMYLSETRECQNKQSPDYLSKCFAASRVIRRSSLGSMQRKTGVHP
jgi:hypothetical protein